MKHLLGLLILLGLSLTTWAQNSPVGLWKTVDDKTGQAKSHIEIYEKNGKYYGKVKQLLLNPADTKCGACTGNKKDKPLVGMVLIEGLTKYEDYWSYGTVMDPETGKVYKCSVWRKGDELTVRGYIGFSALGRNQTWHRVR